MTKQEKCYKCGTSVKHAPGIGDFCPNKNCDVSDNLENRQRTFLEEVTEYQKGYEDGKKAALQWQPIESAPKDGVSILLLEQDKETPTIGFRSRENIWRECSTGSKIDPDYWLPLSVLPPAPEVSE